MSTLNGYAANYLIENSLPIKDLILLFWLEKKAKGDLMGGRRTKVF
jgi:hypothetical protein